MKILRNIAIISAIVFVLSLTAGICFATIGFKDGFSGFIHAFDNNSDMENIAEDKSLSADATGMTDLVLKIGAAKVTVVRENRTDVDVDYTSKVIGSGSNPVTVDRSGNSVHVESNYNNVHHFPFFQELHMTIRIPQEYNGNLSLDVGAGTLDLIGQQSFKAVTLTVGAGDISVDNLQAQSLNADVSVGKFEANQLDTPRLTLDVSTGSADLTFSRLTGDITATVNMGDAEIHLPTDAKATLNLKASMGSVSQDFGTRFVGSSGSTNITGTVNGGGYSISGQVDMGSFSVGT